MTRLSTDDLVGAIRLLAGPKLAEECRLELDHRALKRPEQKTLFPLDLAGVRAMEPASARAVNKSRIPIDEERRLEVTREKAATLNLMRGRRAGKFLDHLPGPRRAIHGVLAGHFSAWDFVPAVLDLAKPAHCKRLDVATLGFNEANAADLFKLFDAGQIEAVSFVVSHYHRAVEREAFAYLHAGLTARGQRCAVVRNHAKLILFEMTDGRHFVIESSANLRSCKNVEQFTLIQDSDVLRFHRQWLSDAIAHVERERAK